MYCWPIFILFCLVVLSSGYRVFVVPHSHCDAGWTSTFEQYYQQKVKFILNTVIDQLSSNPSYVFNWAETGFLYRWWQDGDISRQNRLKSFVSQQRIIFLGGGWVQNDETTTSVRDVLNQLTEGHLWLYDTFQVTPRIGWQIDPFGNVASTPILFALCGFTDTVTDRVDITVTLDRIAMGTMEYIWRPPTPYFQDPVLYDATSIFTHQLGLLLYEGFPFIFEDSDGGSGADPVTPENLAEKLVEFDSTMDAEFEWYKASNHENLLFTWGGDFLFYNASKEFMNMDKIISNVDDTFYSTVSQYFDALRALNNTWPERTGEDLPYDWPTDSYWTGYFSSRAALKGAIRKLSSLVESTDIFYVFSPYKSNSLFNNIEYSRHIMGILQHHDAITGTAKSFVVDDYFLMIKSATTLSMEVLQQSISNIIQTNITSIAPATDTFNIIIVNSLSSVTPQYIQFPLQGPTHVTVPGSLSQVIDNEMFIAVTPPPLGITTLPLVSSQSTYNKINIQNIPFGTPFSIENDLIILNYSSTHMLETWTNKITGNIHPVVHSYKQYESVEGSAYLMRVLDAQDIPTGQITTTVVTGPLVSTACTVINEKLNHTWRLYHGASFAEIVYQINSIPVPGYNLISRFSTDIASNGQFFTDDSGWLITKRTRQSGIENSYFPSVEFSFINETSGRQFSILTRQPHGVSSRNDGEIELNMFRRLANPGFPPLGLGETLDDLALLVETQWIIFSEQMDEHAHMRKALNNPLRVFFTLQKPSIPTFTGLSGGLLPEEVSVFTLKARDCCSKRIMLRLQNHGYDYIQVKNIPNIFGRNNATQYSLNFIDKKVEVNDDTIEPYMIKAYLLS